MKVNLYPGIIEDIDSVASIFIDAGAVINPDIENTVSFLGIDITLSYDLLTFRYGNGPRRNFEDYTTIWVACSLLCETDEDAVKKAAILLPFLNYLPIKPFKDEDAFKGHFRKVFNNNLQCYSLTFFINPNFSDGWWENHVI